MTIFYLDMCNSHNPNVFNNISSSLYLKLKLFKSNVNCLHSVDYDGLCRSLTDKERQLNEVRDRTEEKIEFMQREHTAERLRLEQDKTTAERERDSVR